MLDVVMPGGVGDVAAPSGGNTYDLLVCAGLAAGGWQVRQRTVPGTWPHPAPDAVAALERTLAQVPDGGLVLADGLLACAAPEAVEAHAGRLRCAILVHLPLPDETGLSPAAAADLAARERRALRAATAVIATSRAVAHSLASRYGLDLPSVDVVPPGVAPAPLAEPSVSGGRMLVVAAVTPRKGHDVLAAALSRLAAPAGRRAGIPAGVPWTCVCAGAAHLAPAHADAVRRTVADAGLSGRVTFPGPRTGADLDALYAASDLLILPSRAEPYGMVVTEALARGLPVVASAVDGIPEALGTSPDGTVPGLLVPPGDPAPLASALEAWLTDPGLRERLRAAAAARRGTLRGWDQTTSGLAAVLDRMRRTHDHQPSH